MIDPSTPFLLVKPAIEHLASYAKALERGWSPDNVRGAVAAREELQILASDPTGYVARLEDPEGKGDPIILPDGTRSSRLPGFRRWIWDGAFAGAFGFRWRPGTSDLPSHVLGHIGYAVVPWKQRRGYATKGLAMLLEEVRRIEGLKHVELTADPDNEPSHRVILANDGQLIERFRKSKAYGGAEALRFRIYL